MSEKKYMSLADFAADNSDDVAIIMSRLPEPGTFICRGLDVRAERSKPSNPEQEPMITVTLTHEILLAEPLDTERNSDDLIGRTITERYVLWPRDFREALGMLRGEYTRVGLPVTGPNGGDGITVGWLDGMIGWPYELRINHYTSKSGIELAGFNRKKADPETFEALGINPNPAAGDGSDESEVDPVDKAIAS